MVRVQYTYNDDFDLFPRYVQLIMCDVSSIKVKKKIQK